VRTETRITRFVDWFLQSRYFQEHGNSSDDWINAPDRARRCDEAAEYGSDGSTHQERIQDMREAFSDWIRDRRSTKEHELFISAVDAHFDDLETWHEKNGSLFQQVG